MGAVGVDLKDIAADRTAVTSGPVKDIARHRQSRQGRISLRAGEGVQGRAPAAVRAELESPAVHAVKVGAGDRQRGQRPAVTDIREPRAIGVHPEHHSRIVGAAGPSRAVEHAGG